MEKVTFQDKECFIAYKGLKYNLSNYQNNYTYELNKWYSVLDVDMSDKSCSFGINLCKTKESASGFGCRVFKCYVPVNTKIKFIGNQNKFRCLEMYLTDEESEFAWDELTEEQKNLVCQNPNFQYKKYWNELTWYQKNCVCRYNTNFQYKKYWNELTEYQKDILRARVIKKGVDLDSIKVKVQELKDKLNSTNADILRQSEVLRKDFVDAITKVGQDIAEISPIALGKRVVDID